MKWLTPPANRIVNSGQRYISSEIAQQMALSRVRARFRKIRLKNCRGVKITDRGRWLRRAKKLPIYQNN